MPENPELQTRVLLSALKLLEAPQGPVLEDFPEDVVAAEGEETVWACPVSFPRIEDDLTDNQQLTNAFKEEFTALQPWYDQSMKNRGRTTVGVGGVDLDEICDFICSFLEDELPANPREDLSLAFVLNFVVDDLKAFYYEAVTAQPGASTPGSEPFADWFWGDTIASKVLFAVKQSCDNSSDGMLKIVSNHLLIPMEQVIKNS